MMEGESVKRSNRRADLMAEQTRSDILGAARTLFARDGYASTSIQDIARGAGVAVQTIYSRVGSKRALLMALVDRIDEEAGLGEMVGLVLGATDAEEALDAYVHLTRRFRERCGDVIGALFNAAGAEPDIDEFIAEGRRRHRYGATSAVKRIVELDGLRADLDAPRAAGLAAIATSQESWFELHDSVGLDWDEAERLLASTLRLVLLKPLQ